MPTTYEAYAKKKARPRTLERVTATQEEWHPTKPQPEDIASIIDAAIDIEALLYQRKPHDNALFVLRKCLEGVFGHDCGDELWEDD